MPLEKCPDSSSPLTSSLTGATYNLRQVGFEQCFLDRLDDAHCESLFLLLSLREVTIDMRLPLRAYQILIYLHGSADVNQSKIGDLHAVVVEQVSDAKQVEGSLCVVAW